MNEAAHCPDTRRAFLDRERLRRFLTAAAFLYAPGDTPLLTSATKLFLNQRTDS
jgi:hypothetical protein